MTVELKLNVLMGTVSRYSVVTLVFFTTYIVFQPPSTVIIRYLGPRVHLSTIVTLWGAVMIGMGFVKDWESLAALRVVLGILEAGFFPSCVYLMSTWYTRYDIGKRYSVFYILGSLASACAGMLAYGLMQLKGREGLTGWRWYVLSQLLIPSANADNYEGSSSLKVPSPASSVLARTGSWSISRIRRTRLGAS
jgi:MFS family permease